MQGVICVTKDSIMLHMFTSEIGSGIAHHFDGRLLVADLNNGGRATLIAES